MEVKYLDLQSQFKENREVRQVIDEILSSGQFVMGPAIEEFERNFAELCGVRHAVGVSSGTAALFLALKVLGIGAGDEVITPPNTFLATVGAIVHTGAFPRLVDVADDYNIDPGKIETAINEKTRAIVPVHLTGNPARMDEILAIAEKHNLPVIEDSCCAISAKINGKYAGTFGAGGAFSVHPLKNLNVWGDVGFIVTYPKDVYQNILLLRNHGLKNRDEVEIFGYNARLDTIQAIVGNYLYPKIDEITDRRIANAKRYDEAFVSPELSEYITLPPRRPEARHVYHMYMVRVEGRDKLLDYLIDREIEAKVHYPIPMHLQQASLDQDPPFGRTDLSRTEAQCRSLITLPVHQHL